MRDTHYNWAEETATTLRLIINSKQRDFEKKR